jgi:hypothetical protein
MLLDNISSFISVNSLLVDNGYKNAKKQQEISWSNNYVKIGFETEYFEIKFENNRFYVSVPMKYTTIQYQTSFQDCESAASYLESKFRDYFDL